MIDEKSLRQQLEVAIALGMANKVDIRDAVMRVVRPYLRESTGVTARAIEVDFEKGTVLFDVPDGSRWGLGKYRIIKLEQEPIHDPVCQCRNAKGRTWWSKCPVHGTEKGNITEGANP